MLGKKHLPWFSRQPIKVALQCITWPWRLATVSHFPLSAKPWHVGTRQWLIKIMSSPHQKVTATRYSNSEVFSASSLVWLLKPSRTLRYSFGWIGSLWHSGQTLQEAVIMVHGFSVYWYGFQQRFEGFWVELHKETMFLRFRSYSTIWGLFRTLEGSCWTVLIVRVLPADLLRNIQGV